MITHRIEEINGNTFISIGDANNVKDEPCEIERIEGKVIYHSKFFGIIILYFLKPICIIYGISIFIIELLKNRKKGEKENEKNSEV